MSAPVGAVLAFALVIVVGFGPWGRRSGGRARRHRSSPSLRWGSARSGWRAGPLGAALGLVAVVSVVVVLGPVLGSMAVVALPLGWWLRRRAVGRSAARARDRSVPELVDLLAISASAGLPVASALAVVAPRAPPAVRPAVLAADARRQRGTPLDACLAELGGALGPRASSLVDALRRSAATGVALGPMLREAAAEAREARRRDAEASARRLPVLMLVPLAGCILPAAVLLAVVPVVIVSLAALAR